MRCVRWKQHYKKTNFTLNKTNQKPIWENIIKNKILEKYSHKYNKNKYWKSILRIEKC